MRSMFTRRRLETADNARQTSKYTHLSENARRHRRNQEDRDNPITTGPAGSLFVN
jgi:hypothetical protein